MAKSLYIGQSNHCPLFIGGIAMIALYIRVSTLEQVKEGYSIAAQKERLTAYCKAQGWTDYKFYVDEGVSAKDTNRPELQKLFKDMKDGKINMILVYRLDRFTRRVIDLHRMLEEMKKYDCSFISATEPYDTSSSMGRMFITIVAALAQWENENLSERIVMALEEKVSSGERVGNVPYGFDLTSDEKLIKNEKSLVVLDMIEKTKEGWSASSIADYLTKTNNDKARWHPNSVIRILRNPALYGSTYWSGKVYENTHEGIISKEEFDKIQTILNDRTQFRRRDVESTYLFQGKVVCPDCGNIMTVNRHIRKYGNKPEKQYASYRCNHCWKNKRIKKSVGEKGLLEGLYEYMANIELAPVEKKKEPENNIYEDQLKQIERKREKYQRAWASDLMTDEEFKKLMDETKDIYEDLKRKVEQSEEPKSVNIEEVQKIKWMFNESFKKLTTEEKQVFVSRFIRKIEFIRVPQPPKNPRKSKRGKDKVVIKKVVFM